MRERPLLLTTSKAVPRLRARSVRPVFHFRHPGGCVAVAHGGFSAPLSLTTSVAQLLIGSSPPPSARVLPCQFVGFLCDIQLPTVALVWSLWDLATLT